MKGSEFQVLLIACKHGQQNDFQLSGMSGNTDQEIRLRGDTTIEGMTYRIMSESSDKSYIFMR
ncbi:hypothetical protein PsyrCH409_01815 [Pseudomonas viridiflava]|nr:hypothetical protein RT94_02410 [Pseudomonas viridiflava]KTC13135.1 hypothetical protein AO390_25160 [Pseudomonas marginalis ICMP 11289]ODJ91978.1 hypothetical protein BB779_02580 [Pseudomonas viridiflava]PCK94079.1 hypothetical protein PsyrCH409_01815 [Pseudomonas viridiflava]